MTRQLRKYNSLFFSGIMIIFVVVIAEAAAIELEEDHHFREHCADLAGAAEASGKTTVIGKDGWLFLTAELRHIGVGAFWGEDAKTVSRATKESFADPLPIIVDFNEQLKKAGVRLIFIPVPPKAIIYADMLPSELKPEDIRSARRDSVHQAFYQILREKGVEVLDLTSVFLEARQKESLPIYLQQDTHWSGRGVAIAADNIVEYLSAYDLKPAWSSTEIAVQTREVMINGDLLPGLSQIELIKEKVKLDFYRLKKKSSLELIPTGQNSPILLIGDSHVLVFHSGNDMHAKGAGLPDVIASKLGVSVDLIGVRGSGATPSRISLFRRMRSQSDYLDRKKVIIWCLSAREFTETSGWRKIPIITSAK